MLCAFIVMILGKLIILFSQRADAVCLSSKLESIVYAPSHTQRGYTYNCRVILANRLPLVLLATGVRQLQYLAF